MALTEIPPPDAMKRAFLEGLGANDSVQLHFSLPVYALPLSELAGNADLLRPRAVGWQFLTIDARGVAVAGECPNEPDDPDGRITSSLTRGLTIDEALKASRVLREHPDLVNEPFALRRLRITSLRIDAFWLEALPADDVLGASDLVYPFVAFHQRLKSKLLQAPAFLTIVRQLAREQIGVENAPHPRPPLMPGNA